MLALGRLRGLPAFSFTMISYAPVIPQQAILPYSSTGSLIYVWTIQGFSCAGHHSSKTMHRQAGLNHIWRDCIVLFGVRLIIFNNVLAGKVKMNICCFWIYSKCKFILQAQAVLKCYGPWMALRRKLISRQNAIRSKFESMHFSIVSIKTGLSDLKKVHFTHSFWVLCVFLMHGISNMLNSNEISCMFASLFMWSCFL